ncbi:hypothetical protein NK553_13660 [Pseudomonas sp. ZM23]|uniref:Uncharacterized protein n=1 Tax=Pseudomonas triclosanedens TaxID=2961893 RepID=A0ABY7A683_9PSED|nr:hypothetical protein [Pseudomonas triclosanedens]MCP8464996.1 hypothetical protein [Pseudomonas triclosanedens]MCP8470292.1 hypothetical protein [Pseudomonas triclosanedens]MCP8476097.1 hypothetical protein [Pseudomonas triclosanedens]WAI51670.1 hypothetical protein OU419_10585 [Pseudomonas triclosanedens]
MSEIRIVLRDGVMVCAGFRIQAQPEPSLEIDGDLLWALEQPLWCELAVSVEKRDGAIWIAPLPLARQGGFDPQRVIGWRAEPVRIEQPDGIEDAENAIHWWRGGTVEDVRGRISHHPWGRLLRLEAPGIGPEHILFPRKLACIYLGHLDTDWRQLRFEPLS